MEEERDMAAAESTTDGVSDGRTIELLELDDAGLMARFLGAEEPEDFDGRDSGEEELRSCGPRVILSKMDQLTDGDRDWLRDDTEAAGEDVLATVADATESVGEGTLAALEGERTILAIDADDEREGGERGSLLAPTFRLDSDEVLLRRTATANRLALLLLLLPPGVVTATFVVRPPGLIATGADEEELDEQLDERDELKGATVATFFLDSDRLSDADEFCLRCTGRSEEIEALEPLREPPLSAALLAFEAADEEEADFLACRFALL